ncbi:MAG TPA: hypothetical protein VFI41_12690 [Gemmatimonadales bacterium]|nr:hypothetical protein [Gemmatimonadales bacterium]
MDELFQLALKAMHNGMSRSEVDALIHEDTQGAIPSFDALKTHLAQQDMAGQGTAVEAFGAGALPFLDRISGALDAVGSVMVSPQTGLEGAKQAYLEGRDIVRARNAAYAREHPKMNVAMHILGGAGGALAGSAALRGLGFLGTAVSDAAPTIGQLARAGATAGGVVGGLQGLSDTPDLTNPEQAARDAAFGAGTGALAGGVLGAATKPALSAAGGAVRLVRGMLPDFVPGSISRAAATEGSTAGLASSVLPPNVSEIVSRLERSAPGEVTLGDANRGEVMDAALTRAPDLKPRVAQDLIERSGRAGGILASQAEQATGAALPPGAQGPTLPSAADMRASVQDRAMTGGTRLAAAAEQAAGVPGIDAIEARAAARAARPALRARTFAVLERDNPEIDWNSPTTKKLQDAMQLPEIAAVLPEVNPGETPANFQRFQTAAQTLRDRADAIYAGGARGDARLMRGMAERLEQGMEDAFPGYGQARLGWAENQAVEKGTRLGKNAVNLDERQIAQNLRDFGPETRVDGTPNTVSEEARNAYRLSAADSYVASLRNLEPGSDAAKKALQRGDQSIEGRLRVILGDNEQVSQYMERIRADRLVEAHTLGAKALDEAPERIPEILQSFGEGPAGAEARTAYRVRMLDEYTSDLRNMAKGANAGRAAVQRSNQQLESRLRAAFGSSAEMDKFFETAAAQEWLHASREAIAGSKTTPRTELVQSLFGPRNFGGRLWRKLATWVQADAQQAADRQTAGRMVDFLGAKGPEMQQNLSAVEAQRAAAAAARGALPGQATTAGMFGGTTGGKQFTAGAVVGPMMLAPSFLLPGFLRHLSGDQVAGAQ